MLPSKYVPHRVHVILTLLMDENHCLLTCQSLHPPQWICYSKEPFLHLNPLGNPGDYDLQTSHVKSMDTAFLPFNTTEIMSSFNLQTAGLVSHGLPPHRFYNIKKIKTLSCSSPVGWAGCGVWRWCRERDAEQTGQTTVQTTELPPVKLWLCTNRWWLKKMSSWN